MKDGKFNGEWQKKRFLATCTIKSSSESIQGRQYPWQDTVGLRRERDNGWDPHLSGASYKARLVSPKKQTFLLWNSSSASPICKADYLHSCWSRLPWATAHLLGSWGQEQKQQVDWVGWILQPKSILEVFRTSLPFLPVKKLRSCALGKKLNLSLALLTWLGLPVPRDHDIHSAAYATPRPPSR